MSADWRLAQTENGCWRWLQSAWEPLEPWGRWKPHSCSENLQWLGRQSDQGTWRGWEQGWGVTGAYVPQETGEVLWGKLS